MGSMGFGARLAGAKLALLSRLGAAGWTADRQRLLFGDLHAHIMQHCRAARWSLLTNFFASGSLPRGIAVAALHFASCTKARFAGWMGIDSNALPARSWSWSSTLFSHEAKLTLSETIVARTVRVMVMMSCTLATGNSVLAGGKKGLQLQEFLLLFGVRGTGFRFPQILKRLIAVTQLVIAERQIVGEHGLERLQLHR
jgi:hypothetical protein